jgi:hypothetical protein
VNRRWDFACRYRPQPRLVFRRLRVKHDAPDYFAVAISHIVIIRRPPIAATAFFGRLTSLLLSVERDIAMGKNPYEIFGPFEVNGEKVADKEYQKAFWADCDQEFAQISEANGLYLFSLCNGDNFEPNYVGITKKQLQRSVQSQQRGEDNTRLCA